MRRRWPEGSVSRLAFGAGRETSRCLAAPIPPPTSPPKFLQPRLPDQPDPATDRRHIVAASGRDKRAMPKTLEDYAMLAVATLIVLPVCLIVGSCTLFLYLPPDPGPETYPLDRAETVAIAERRLARFCNQMTCERAAFEDPTVTVQDRSSLSRAMAVVTYSLRADPGQQVRVLVAWNGHAKISMADARITPRRKPREP